MMICWIAGKKAYELTWGFQYVNLFMINTGYIILAGSTLKVKRCCLGWLVIGVGV